MIGRTIFEFISFGEEGESVESRIARVNEAYAKVGFFRSNVRFSRRTGPPILCECFGIPFLGEGGRADLTIVALIDRSTEERRRVLLADFADRAGKFASDLAQFSESAAVRVEGKRLSRLGFTPRQVEIARFVFEGCPSKEIGYKLGIAESTVKNHLAAMFKKIGATSRVDFLHKLIEERIWIA
jgi:DNA-binding CsgD family transcriptional regulator